MLLDPQSEAFIARFEGAKPVEALNTALGALTQTVSG
jgi:hypothetical protein